MTTRATRLYVVLFIMVAALAANGCRALPTDNDMTGSTVIEPIPGELTIVNPMSRPSPMAAGNGAAFLTILNGLDADVQLVSAESTASEAAELHETVNDDGVMRMIPRPEGFTVAAGGRVELKPGGKHLMLINLVEPLEPGQKIEITLNFDHNESIVVTIPVTEMSGEMPVDMD